jgi:hypothetical protein
MPKSALSPRKTPDSSDADLSLVRHPGLFPTDNSLTMNSLSLCLKKLGISGPVRHPSLGNPRSCTKSTTRLSHTPPPTTYNPPGGADLSFLRHLDRSPASKPINMSNLSLCPHKHEISGLVRHPPHRETIEV